MCRWRGFTAEIDSPLPQDIILEDCPDILLKYINDSRTKLTPELEALADEYFPTRSKEDLQALPDAGRQDQALLRNTTNSA